MTPEKKQKRKRMNASLMLSALLAPSPETQTRRGPADRRLSRFEMSDCEEEQRQQITSLSACPNIPHPSRSHLASCCWPRPDFFSGNFPATKISKNQANSGHELCEEGSRQKKNNNNKNKYKSLASSIKTRTSVAASGLTGKKSNPSKIIALPEA